MLFNSFSFVFFFLPIALIGFYATSRLNMLLARLWLALVSIAFYLWWHPPFAVLLIISVAFNYSASTLVRRLRGKPAQIYILSGAIGANLLALFYYKYAFAITASLVSLGAGHTLWAQGVLLPLGISFFTFTQIGFLLDCKEAVKESSVIDYTLFVTFFPHLIAGPILHHKEIMPQFANPLTYRFQADNFARGYSLFVIGMLKKVVFADTIGPIATSGFSSVGTLQMLPAWGAVLCYSLQLYFDFSGYSDMAIGIATMFNVKFPLNFNSPYKADSIIEFWQRWHMTLTRYITQYLFTPMATRATRKRAAQGFPITRKAMAQPKPFLMTVAGPIFFTMIIAGIWHGAGLQFLIFGLLHACYLVCNHTWRNFGPKRLTQSKEQGPALTVFYVGLTYLAVLVGQIFFRAASTSDAFTLLSAMVGAHGVGASLPVAAWMPAHLGWAGTWLLAHGFLQTVSPLMNGTVAIRTIAEVALCYGIVWFAPNSQTIVGFLEFGKKGSAERERNQMTCWLPLRFDLAWGACIGLLSAVAILEIGARSEFLYFKF